MKKLCFMVLFSILVSLSVGCGAETSTSGEGEKETVVLKLAENQPENYPTTQGVKAFASSVEEKTKGRYQIEVYAGGQLGDEKSVIEQIQLGTIDLARVNVTPLTEFSDDIGVLALPYLFNSEEQQWKVLNGEVGMDLLHTLQDANMVGLAFYDSGKRSFYNSVRPVHSPEDLEGLAIRVQQSKMIIDMVESLGASATPMAFEEVYSSLQTGVLDGAENNFPSYYSTNHYEVAPYYTLDGHSTVPEVVIASSELWESLDEEDKTIFLEAAKDSIEVQREAWAELVDEARQTIEDNGNEIIEITDVAPWREAVQPVYDNYGEQYEEWIDRIAEVE
ncbi:TRAP transporter substrate-binding protein [Caldalkalibacillus salinus]|uniref:TRAP transporter substrate-binding protein n=1 Tax=Caldalkalibacillus salinus TaxID=2803787 RepID=UPI001F23812C|nr:TRAP transporter substrate-binding protein [Caldalkalibacillus salinus]